MNLRSAIGYALLILAAIGSYFVVYEPEPDSPPAVDNALISGGYYMLGAEVRGFGVDGNYLYALNAREIAEDREGSIVRLGDVELLYRDDVDIPWRLSATSGELASDGSRLELIGDVVARNLAGDVPTSLTTTSLTVNPQRYELSTDARVTLRVGERSISATGMLAFLNEDRIEFRSNVSGKFLP
ncbi:MAG: LPS export ABC transporter periplasmic protein LptC [Pseudomonadota bacterium]